MLSPDLFLFDSNYYSTTLQMKKVRLTDGAWGHIMVIWGHIINDMDLE